MSNTMNLYQRLLAKAYYTTYNPRRSRLIVEVEKRLPGYRSYINDLSKGEATGVGAYPWRALDQMTVLLQLKPKRIVELGGGTSTGLFARYVHETPESSLLSIDESADWGALTLGALDRSGLTPHARVELVHATRLENAKGSYYDRELPSDIGLLYIDGPSVMTSDGQKTANQDVLHLLDHGGRPDCIMVDGRVATVKAILSHAAAGEYDFVPGMPYLFKVSASLNSLLHFGSFHRHSVFIRR